MRIAANQLERDVRTLGFIILSIVLGIQVAAAAPEIRPEKWARPVIGAEVGNLYQVSSDLYRSEQPEGSDIADLQALGIHTLMNLREYHSDSTAFERSGFILLRHPMAAGSVSAADLVTVLREIQSARKPVLVHCWHGSDRTGFIVAGYRIVMQGWSKAEAIDELRRGGFGYHERTYPNVKKALEALDVDAVRQQVLGKTAPKKGAFPLSRKELHGGTQNLPGLSRIKSARTLPGRLAAIRFS